MAFREGAVSSEDDERNVQRDDRDPGGKGEMIICLKNGLSQRRSAIAIS